jgi:hypothetical protein
MKKTTAKINSLIENIMQPHLLTDKSLLSLVSAGSQKSTNTAAFSADAITQAVESTSDTSPPTPGNGAGLRPPFS